MSGRPGTIQPTWRVRTLKVGDRVELRRRWYAPQILPLAIFFGLLMLGALGASILSPVMLTVVVIIGIGEYFLLGMVINTTYVYIEDDWLRVKTRPLPSYPDTEFFVPDIAYLELDIPRYDDVQGMVTYDLYAITHSGERHKLLATFYQRDDAHFFLQELEFILGLNENEPRKEKNA